MIRRHRNPGKLYRVNMGPCAMRAPGKLWPANLRSGASRYSPLTKSLDLQTDASDELVWYVEGPEHQLTKTTPFTISAWIKTTQAAALRGQILGKYNSTSHLDNKQRGYALYHVDGGLVLHMATEDEAVNRSYKQGHCMTAGLNDGAWHHVAGTSDGAADPEILLYKDGSALSMSTSGGTLTHGTLDSAAKLVVGRYDVPGVAYYEYFEGRVCHACIYSGVALTEAEVAAIQADGPMNLAEMPYSGQLGFWSTLGDGCSVGTETVPDLAAGNDGTTLNIESGDFVADVPA